MDVHRLKQAFQALPPLEAGDSFWRDKRSELRQRIVEDDPASFLTWPTVTSTMFVGEAPYIRGMYDALMSDDAGRWGATIREDNLGKPARLSYAPDSSGNLVRQAYFILMWEQATRKRITELWSIVEIGGGYGAMAKVARRAGFSGRYTIYDLPEFSLLQEFYLSACQVEAEYRTEPKSQRPNLLIALWSLSEMQDEHSEAILRNLMPGGVLIASNAAEVTNRIKARFKGAEDYPLPEALSSNLVIR